MSANSTKGSGARNVPEAVAFLIHPHDTALADHVRLLGGGWEFAINLWAGQLRPGILTLVARDEDRIRLRAPVAAMAADSDDLGVALRWACDALVGKSCLWTISQACMPFAKPILEGSGSTAQGLAA